MYVRLCITPSAHIPAHSPGLQVVAKVKVLLPFFSFLHQTINDFIQLYIFKFLSVQVNMLYQQESGNTEPQRVSLRSSNPAIIRGHCSYHRVQIKYVFTVGWICKPNESVVPHTTVHDAA